MPSWQGERTSQGGQTALILRLFWTSATPETYVDLAVERDFALAQRYPYVGEIEVRVIVQTIVHILKDPFIGP